MRVKPTIRAKTKGQDEIQKVTQNSPNRRSAKNSNQTAAEPKKGQNEKTQARKGQNQSKELGENEK